MQAQSLFYLIVFIVVADFIWEQLLNYFNKKSYAQNIPSELAEICPEDKYQKGRLYAFDKDRLNYYSSVFALLLMLGVLFSGAFGKLDDWLSALFTNTKLQSLAFFGVLGLVSLVIKLPFSAYATFGIEEKYGFNRMRWSTFFADQIKGLLLGAVFGGGLLYCFLWFHDTFPTTYWLYFWVIFTAFSLLIMMFYTTWLAPLFNKLTPLPDGELKTMILNYCKKVQFPLKNVFIMDGSKRSTKANAYFSGLGKSRNIVLFDTLVDNYSIQELESVLAHEVGHYKKKHTLQMLFVSVLSTLFLLFIMHLVIDSPQFSYALGGSSPKIHLGLISFYILFEPVSMLTGLFTNILSRKNEYEADAYAVQTSSGQSLIDSLKKLSVDSLTHFTPHKLYVFFHYSHPPLLKRIQAIRQNINQ